MTERTHDLFALTALSIAFVAAPLTPISLVTLIIAVIANQIGSAFPDLDQPTAEFYRELPAGSLIGKLVVPLLGTHRFISHSLLGMGIIGYGMHLVLTYFSKYLTADMNIIWWAFIFGYLSHLIADSLTKDGVPWFFPLPVKIGFPPFAFLRITTGKFVEKVILYPALFAVNGYLIYLYYGKFAEFFSNYLLR